MKSKTVAVFDLYLSTVYVYRPDLVTYAQVMRDVEIQFATAYENAKDRHLEFSIEALPERDADILFIGLADENPSTNLNALAVLKQPI
ncbi:hypothetical protein HC931_27985 [Candidatus Gracilibacteria bacterium]|nr:hypothetical protein [Candidatus Gracilibacteria bacterium]NJM86069.1 hypothetical protein [Hydrococcus sp. RU_2_2]NJP20185.1 hypothetical protein [Hydrococcus sp. CRU_1_1]